MSVYESVFDNDEACEAYPREDDDKVCDL
jgi:hypothetical protein